MIVSRAPVACGDIPCYILFGKNLRIGDVDRDKTPLPDIAGAVRGGGDA